jgi:hypothetical protein
LNDPVRKGLKLKIFAIGKKWRSDEFYYLSHKLGINKW